MAELGDFVEQGPKSRGEVTLEMMDYKFVDECTEPTVLRAILAKLKSGEEGSYPHLAAHTEERLLSLLPAKERSKVESLRKGPSPIDVADAQSALQQWTSNVKTQDEILAAAAAEAAAANVGGGAGAASASAIQAASISEEYANQGSSGRELPPVRGSKSAGAHKKKQKKNAPSSSDAAAAAAEKKVAEEEEAATARVGARTPSSHVYDAPDYFRKWDKYDADAAAEQVDKEEEARMVEAAAARAQHEAKEQQRKARRETELADLRGKLSWSSMSEVQRTRFALQEKAKGNECFKAGEADASLSHYSRALALLGDNHEQSPVLWANRAMAALKLGVLEKAEEDCTQALALAPAYDKARLRRGMTRHKRGKYALAAADFQHLMDHGVTSNMPELPQLLARSQQMQSQVDGETSGKTSSASKTAITEVSSKMRVPIVEGAPPLLPTTAGWSRMPFVDPPAPTPAAATRSGGNFTKVAISFDDSDSEESEEEKEETKGGGNKPQDKGEGGNGSKSMFRVPIEDDNDEVEEEEDGVFVPPITNGVKVVIEDETPSSEEEIEVETEAGQAGEKSTAAAEGGGGGASNASASASASASGASGASGEVSEWDLAQRKRQGVQLFSATRYSAAQGIFAKALADVEDASRREGKAHPSELFPSSNLWHAFHNNLAACALATERWQDVITHCSAVLQVQPANVKALLRRAEARSRLQQYGGASSDCQAVLRIEPQNVVATEKLQELSATHAPGTAGAATAAAAAAGNATPANVKQQKAPPNPASEAAKTKGNQAMGRNAHVEAHGHYTEALSLDPTNTAARNNRALCSLQQSHWKAAADDTSRVLDAEPNNAKALFRRAWALEELDQLPNARSDLKAALVLEPSNPKAKEALQRVEAKQARKDAAAAALVKGQLERETSLAEARAGAAAQAQAHARATQAAEVKAAAAANAEAKKKKQKEEEEEEEAAAAAAAEKNKQKDKDEDAFLAALANQNTVDIEEDEGERFQESAAAAVPEKATRVQIQEDSDSDDSDDDAPVIVDVDRKEIEIEKVKEAVSSVSPKKEEEVPSSLPRTTRVQIQEEDDDDDEDGFSPYEEEAKARSDDAKNAGNAAMAAGDFTKAIKCYDASLARNAQNFAALNNRSAAHLRLHQWEAAIADATGVLAEEPRNQKALFRRAEGRRLEAKAKQQQDQPNGGAGSSGRGGNSSATKTTAAQALALAAADLEAILRLDPNNSDAQTKLLALEQETAALSSSSSLLTESSNESFIGGVKVAIRDEDDDDDEATLPPSSTTSSNPTGTRSRPRSSFSSPVKNANASTSSSNINSSDATTSTSSTSNSTSSSTSSGSSSGSGGNKAKEGFAKVRVASDQQKDLGNACLSRGDLTAAERHYSESLRLDPTNWAAQNNRTLCRLKQHNWLGAEADATAVLEPQKALLRDGGGGGIVVSSSSGGGGDPGNLKALARRAAARESMGSLPGAIADYEAWVSKCQDASEKETVRGKLQKCRDKLKQQEAKARHTSSALKDDPMVTRLAEAAAAAKAKKAAADAAAANAPPLIVEADTNGAAPSPPLPPSPSSSSSSFSFSSPALKSPTATTTADNKKNKTKKKSTSSSSSPSAAVSTPPPATQRSSTTPSSGGGGGSKAGSPRVIKVQVKVPKEPPTTLYELERVWRELKGDSDLLASYVRTFKPSTIKKVLKDPSKAPDVLSQLLAVTATRLAAPHSSTSPSSPAASPASSEQPPLQQQPQQQRDLAAAARTLKGLSQCTGFGMALLLLSDQDKAHVRAAANELAASPKYAAAAEEIRSAFRV